MNTNFFAQSKLSKQSNQSVFFEQKNIFDDECLHCLDSLYGISSMSNIFVDKGGEEFFGMTGSSDDW